MDHTHEPGMGHNRPPATIEDQATNAITDGLRRHLERTEQLVASYGRAPEIKTEDDAENITTLCRLLSVQIDNLEAAHREVKAPFLRANAIIDNLTGREREKLIQPLEDLNAKLTAYQTKVAEALKAKRDQEKIELAERGEPEPIFEEAAPKKVVTRSVQGAKATLQDQKVYTVTDVKKVPLVILRNQKVLDAIVSVARARLNQGEEVKGITMSTVAKSRITG